MLQIKLVEKDSRSFHLRKTVGKNVYDYKYSLRTQSCQLLKNGTPTLSESTFNSFFSNHKEGGDWMHQRDFNEALLDLISTDETRELFNYAIDKLSCVKLMEYSKIAYRGLSRLIDRTALQTLYFAGFPLSVIQRGSFDQDNSTPAKILNVPKYAVHYLRSAGTIKYSDTSFIRSLDEAVGGNNAKMLLAAAEEEGALSEFFGLRIFFELVEDYGYTDHKKLLLYLIRDVKLNQGITSPSNAAILLRDYNRMSKALGYPRYERYSKNLHKDHDIASMNYKVVESALKNKNFADTVEANSYKALEYKDRSYVVTVPKDIKQVVDEGSSLSHCVASYVDDIIAGKCRILLIRRNKDTDSPLLTAEIRGNRLRQVRGSYNRKPTETEWRFIDKWAEKKNLEVVAYRGG